MYQTKRALTVQELEDIIADPKFFEELESATMVVLPPDADSLTDEDEADEDIIGMLHNIILLRILIIQYLFFYRNS